MLDFVKAASSPDRLRIIGALTRGPANAAQIAECLGISFRRAVNHLALLAHLDILQPHVAEKQDDLYEPDMTIVENLARVQFEDPRAKYVPALELDAKSRKVIADYSRRNGSLKTIPAQRKKLEAILRYLVKAFTPGKRYYSEKKVNEILRSFHPDTASLWRELVGSGLMKRGRRRRVLES